MSKKDTIQRVIGGLQLISGLFGVAYGGGYGAGSGGGNMIGMGIANLQGKDTEDWWKRKGGWGQDFMNSLGFGIGRLNKNYDPNTPQNKYGTYGEIAGGLAGAAAGSSGGGGAEGYSFSSLGEGGGSSAVATNYGLGFGSNTAAGTGGLGSAGYGATQGIDSDLIGKGIGQALDGGQGSQTAQKRDSGLIQTLLASLEPVEPVTPPQATTAVPLGQPYGPGTSQAIELPPIVERKYGELYGKRAFSRLRDTVLGSYFSG